MFHVEQVWFGGTMFHVEQTAKRCQQIVSVKEKRQFVESNVPRPDSTQTDQWRAAALRGSQNQA